MGQTTVLEHQQRVVPLVLRQSRKQRERGGLSINNKTAMHRRRKEEEEEEEEETQILV